MKSNPLVSVIVPTKNSSRYLERCLKSIRDQQYKNIEIIVVDNNSSDETKAIAYRYTKNVFDKGPERSTQRNFGAKKAKGQFLLFLDSDMELTDTVITECVEAFNQKNKRENIGGIIIPEVSFGKGFWAKCKALERSYYVGLDWIEAERFFVKSVFDKLNGFDEAMISGEDWDLNQRLRLSYEVRRIKGAIRHNEGEPRLLDLIKKKLYYAKKIKRYSSKKINTDSFSRQANLLNRYILFLSQPRKLFKNPLVGLGVLFMKTCEFAGGVIGYLSENKK